MTSNASIILSASLRSQPGFYLASVLAAAKPDAMGGLYKNYVASNPQLNQVDLIKYVSHKGFIDYTPQELMKETEWTPKDDDDDQRPEWKSIWGRNIPQGTPWYGTLRDQRGNKIQLAFLGSTQDVCDSQVARTLASHAATQ